MNKEHDNHLENTLRHHLRLFDAPSANQLAESRQRIVQRLSARRGTSLDKIKLPANERTIMPRWGLLAAAAAVLIAVVMTASLVRHASPMARVELADGSLFRVSGDRSQVLQRGDSIHRDEIIHANGGTGSVIELADGSRVEMRSQSDLVLERANDGTRIRLSKGGVIVNAAKQHGGHLYVTTKDVTVTVVGTVFLVSAEETGSRVAVIEGEVRVKEGSDEKKLRPGEQIATNPLMASRAVKEEIAWSRNAEEHLAMLQQSAAPATALIQAVPERFEVASIRPSGPLPQGTRGGGPATPIGARCLTRNRLDLSPGRFATTRMTAHALIAAAYSVSCLPTDRILGEPDWVTSEAYDLQATIPIGSPIHTAREFVDGSAPALQKMLQNLLGDRFKFSVRHETREMAAYNLVVVKPGKWDCQTPPTCHGLRLSENQDPEAAGDPNPPPIITTIVSLHTSLSTWAQNAAANSVGRPVIDKTGLKGFYDIRLEYPDMPETNTVDDLNRNQEIMKGRFVSTIQEQLGFKLEPTTARVEILVVEHVEKPSEN
jgi:uncharacterized protein (TIGR03435 family)